jgi:hypothetical protein
MRSTIFLSLLLLTACVGTDAINDEIVTLSISIEETLIANNTAAATVGSDHQFKATATNDRGTTYEPGVTWNSSNATIATIDENGTLQAENTGRTSITATTNSVQSSPIMITVVQSDDEIALIEITGSSSISVNEEITLSARALNASGQEIPGAPISWQSENEDVALVNSQGDVTGLRAGIAPIIARSQDISGSFSLSVGQAQMRSGTFEGSSGYNVEGAVVLELDSGDTLSLKLQDDFRSSVGPGLYIYLTNQAGSISGGVEVARLRSASGADTYEVPEGITINQYSNVLIYCKPFGVPFGVAELDSDS